MSRLGRRQPFPPILGTKLNLGTISLDATSNSGYQAATASLSWFHPCTGINRFLTVAVELLSVNNTVATLTANGVALTLIGAQNVVGGTGRVEQWGLVAPATSTVSCLDHFTGTNGTDLTAHTMDTGSGWAIVEVAPVIQIQGNAAKAITLDIAKTKASYVTDALQANATVQASCTLVASGNEVGLIFRYQDSSNFWAVSAFETDGKFYVYKISSGTITQPYGPFTAGVVINVAFVMKIVCSGNNITLYNGTTAVGSFTDSFLNMATKFGIRSWQVNNTWDDFEVDGAGIPIAVALSGSLACAGTAISYTGVHQTVPTEAWNGNSGINAGSGTNATVVITPVANNDWIIGALATSQSSGITSSQTSRNNVAGALGTGADSDTGPISPAAATTMTWTGEGLTSMWATAGFALRPVGASSGAFTGDDDNNTMTYITRYYW